MGLYFEEKLSRAIERCSGHLLSDSYKFEKIYPFTTENISGYMPMFDLKDKKLLTVGSSSDQAINANMQGCKDVTVLDLCPYTKEYFYLKKAAYLNLEYEEFFSFFCYKDYPELFKGDNEDVFNRNTYRRLESNIRNLDYESYLFWGELFENFEGKTVRKNLFSDDENRKEILILQNMYLRTKENYELERRNIKNFNPRFIIKDIFDADLVEKYNTIFLSNIGDYYDPKDYKKNIDQLKEYLTFEGKLLVSYLYQMKKDTPYNENWAPIYDFEKTLPLFFDASLETFIGIRGLIFESEEITDAALIYQKR